MFAHINGIVDEILTDRVIIDVGGIGYELLCSAATLRALRPGEEFFLYTYFQIGQDAISLYGFMEQAERAMFRKLIGVSRVGPKVALSVLSNLSVSDIAGAILTENAAAFDHVPGMGRKTAARLLLELKETVGRDDMLSAGISAQAADGQGLDMRTEAIAALISLGYDGASAGRAVNTLPDYPRVEEMITAALREMARKV